MQSAVDKLDAPVNSIKGLKKALIALVLVLPIILGGAVYYWWSSYLSTPIALNTSFIFDTPRPLAPFNLKDQYGNDFSNSSLQGKWSLFFIGYTSCPDVCPTTLNRLNAAYPELLKVSKDTQIVFVSADPARDTQTKRLDYINFFNKAFKAVSAEHTLLFPFSRDLGFAYAMVGEDQNYQVDHSASYVLVSPKGEKYAVFKTKPTPGELPQITNAELIEDFRKIVKQYNTLN